MPDDEFVSTVADVLENELLVRAFMSAFNTRSIDQIAPFLSADVAYQPRTCECVRGRDAVLAVFSGLFENITVFEFLPEVVAVSGTSVLAEQRVRVQFPGEATHELFGLATFTVGDGFVRSWRQLHA
ncbi:nuclear transport factor 2 family protein [Curtobacterium sp. KT1]|uniref:nuclear transport factor 2 family protein n=1 Tax=Curtobacterium sp. KT1 TaxID=3372858 RepID=UPI0037C0AAC9